MFNLRDIHTLQINYRSGTSMRFRVYEFNFKRNETGVCEASWTNVNKFKNDPIHMSIQDIESIWRIKTSRGLLDSIGRFKYMIFGD